MTEGPVDVASVRWGLGDVAIGAVVALVGSQIALAIVGAASHRDVADSAHWPLTLQLLTELGLWAGLLGVPVAVARAKGNGVVRDFHLRARWADLGTGGAVGAVLQIAVLPLLYVPLLHLVDKTSHDLEGPARRLSDGAHGIVGVSVLVLFVGIAAPVIEEIFYRGLFLRALRNRGLGPVPSVLIVAVVFGLSHGELLQLPALILFGACAGWLAVRYDRLGPSIAAHVAFNMVTVVALLAAK